MQNDSQMEIDRADAAISTGQIPSNDDGQGPESEKKAYKVAYVESLRAEAAGYRKQLDALAKAEAERKEADAQAETQRLAEQAKWQELAEKRGGELEALKTEAKAQAEAAKRYAETLTVYLAKEREGVPSEIAILLDKLDVVDQLAYIAEQREKWAKPISGIPASPKPGQTQAPTPEERRQQAFKISL